MYYMLKIVETGADTYMKDVTIFVVIGHEIYVCTSTSFDDF